MRLDSDVIAWLKAGGRGYQAKANWLVRQAMLDGDCDVALLYYCFFYGHHTTPK